MIKYQQHADSQQHTVKETWERRVAVNFSITDCFIFSNVTKIATKLWKKVKLWQLSPTQTQRDYQTVCIKQLCHTVHFIMKRHLCCVTSSLSRKPRANKAFNVNLKAIKSFKLFNRKMATPQRKNNSWMTVTLFLTCRWLTFNRGLLKTDAVVPTTASVLFL